MWFETQNCAMMGLQATTVKRKLEAAAAVAASTTTTSGSTNDLTSSPAKNGRWEAAPDDCIARLQAVAVPSGDAWRTPTPSLAATLLSSDDFEDDDDDFEDDFNADEDRCSLPPVETLPPLMSLSSARFTRYRPHTIPTATTNTAADYWQYYHQPSTIQHENGKSYLELGAAPPSPPPPPLQISAAARCLPPPPLPPPPALQHHTTPPPLLTASNNNNSRCCDGRTRWCHVPCYRQRRLAVLNLSMCKLARYRQCSDPSLRRSVLICNTLRRLEREMEAEPPDPPPLPPPPLTAPANSYEQNLRDMTCASGRATPFPTTITCVSSLDLESERGGGGDDIAEVDSGLGDDEDDDADIADADLHRPINWGSVLSLTSQTDLEPLNNNDLYADLGLQQPAPHSSSTVVFMESGGGEEWKETVFSSNGVRHFSFAATTCDSAAAAASSSTNDWDGFVHVLVGGST